MIWHRPDGTSFVLAYHTPNEWADLIYDKLRALGCSEAYAASVADRYRLS